MLSQIKELLTNAQLQEKIKGATTLAETMQMIAAAGAEKGYKITTETISHILAELTAVESYELSEEELLSVSGARSGHTSRIDVHCTSGSCSNHCTPT
ncbi:Nif11-like leader peptide family natural product precursor [Anabaena catenula]|uniref:Nif11-like leader peptide family natural product n=1 Tax=Anabaena catenula FACHB-362 TaxID=2692877 RepID=A0ABR8J8J0_9NOST|nr:Nif11-like leader peptide family natural product precursor [Anabaena catenula]MBD2694682.1 Nif11-like leader peptide family natural product precursor [Anabaena catenula FACHB-362]